MTSARPARWPVVVGALVGAVLFGVGVWSLLDAAGDTHPSASVAWLLGLALAHDLLLVPVVLLVGAGVRRFAPAASRSLLGAALLISGTVGLVAWPLVRGYGRSPGNPSLLPRDYGKGLLVVLVLVWSATLALGLLARRQQHTRDPGGTTP